MIFDKQFIKTATEILEIKSHPGNYFLQSSKFKTRNVQLTEKKLVWSQWPETFDINIVKLVVIFVLDVPDTHFCATLYQA